MELKEEIFESNMGEIDSFDAYYKNVILNNNNLVVPYINLGINNHSLNSSSKLQYIDYAYIVFEEISYLTVFIAGRRLDVLTKNKSKELYDFGGTYLDFQTGIFNDFEICAKKAYLETLSISHLSDSVWTPIPVPNFLINMDLKVVEQFYKNDFLPQNLKTLIK